MEALRDDGPRRRTRLEEEDYRRGRGGERRDEELRQRGDGGGRRGREDMLVEERRAPRREGARREVPQAEPAHGAPPAHGAAARGEGGDAANFKPDATYEKEYARDPGHVSVGEIKFQHALKQFDHTKAILRAGAQADSARFRLPQLIPSHLPGQGL